MFTGIIEAVGDVIAINHRADQTLVRIGRPGSFTDLKNGSSIACDGICLTVLTFAESWFEVQIMNETTRKSTAGTWKPGYKVNLERALRLGDRLDGHWVQGHVDRTAKLLETRKEKETQYLRLSLDREDQDLVVPQGSITLNGVSLTLSALSSSYFEVALIGHTLDNTNLSHKRSGDMINIEYDVLGKYLRRGKKDGGISREWLYEQGF